MLLVEVVEELEVEQEGVRALFISPCRFLKTDGSLCAMRKCLLTGLARPGGSQPTTTTGIGESVSNSAVCFFSLSLSPPSEESANRRTVTTAAAVLLNGQPATVVVGDTKHPIAHFVLSCLKQVTVVPTLHFAPTESSLFSPWFTASH